MKLSLFKALGIIDCCIFKRIDEQHFETVYAESEWIDLLLPSARDNKKFTIPTDSPFLDDFLMQAEEFWEYADYGKIDSGVWNEEIENNELKLNAYADIVEREYGSSTNQRRFYRSTINGH